MRSPTITTILERLRQAREQARVGHESTYGDTDAFPWVGWPEDAYSTELLRPDDISGSELWFLPPNAPKALPALSPMPSPDDRHVLHVVMWDNTTNSEWP